MVPSKHKRTKALKLNFPDTSGSNNSGAQQKQASLKSKNLTQILAVGKQRIARVVTPAELKTLEIRVVAPWTTHQKESRLDSLVKLKTAVAQKRLKSVTKGRKTDRTTKSSPEKRSTRSRKTVNLVEPPKLVETSTTSKCCLLNLVEPPKLVEPKNKIALKGHKTSAKPQKQNVN